MLWHKQTSARKTFQMKAALLVLTDVRLWQNLPTFRGNIKQNKTQNTQNSLSGIDLVW